MKELLKFISESGNFDQPQDEHPYLNHLNHNIHRQQIKVSQQGYKETLESPTKNGKLIMQTPKTESNKVKEKNQLTHYYNNMSSCTLTKYI